MHSYQTLDKTAEKPGKSHFTLLPLYGDDFSSKMKNQKVLREQRPRVDLKAKSDRKEKSEIGQKIQIKLEILKGFLIEHMNCLKLFPWITIKLRNLE